MTASMIPLRPLGAVAAYSIIAATAIGMLYYGRALLMPLAIAILIWHLINALAATYHRPTLAGRHLPSWLCYVAALTTIFGGLAIMAQLITDNVNHVSAAAPAYESNLRQLLTAMYELVGLKSAPKIVVSAAM
jgi:predicted PurR-regulated permease PerM